MRLTRFLKPVYAHCDLPCGIYEVDTMRHAADTCLRMIEKIETLGDIKTVEDRNSLIRAVNIKEQHAHLCKTQLYTLWSDYFKPEHLQSNPDLHDKMWQAAKQCSKVKQTVSKDECQKLINLVGEVADLFARTK